MSSDRLAVAVIGTGYGEEHVRAFAGLPDVDVVAVVSGTPERAEIVGARHDVGVRTNDFSEVLALDRLDAVSIAVPPAVHREIAEAAFARRCHVLCEKPLGRTVSECEAMLAAAEGSGLVHATNYDWRTVPNFAKLHRLLAEGWIGHVRHARLVWTAPWESDPTKKFGWRHSSAQAGFGVLGDQSHLLDDLLWNFGPLARVSADFRTIVTERSDQTGARRACDVEDDVAFVAVARDGTQITAHLSRCGSSPGYRRAEYEGTDGTLTLLMPDGSDRERSTLTGRRVGAPPVDLSEPASTSIESTHARFVRAVRDPSVGVVTSFESGLEVVRLAEALRESSESGRWISPT